MEQDSRKIRKREVENWDDLDQLPEWWPSGNADGRFEPDPELAKKIMEKKEEEPKKDDGKKPDGDVGGLPLTPVPDDPAGTPASRN